MKWKTTITTKQCQDSRTPRVTRFGVEYAAHRGGAADTAFAKGKIEFGDVDTERKKQSKELLSLRNVLEDMERDIKPKPHWWKAMMWWKK